MSRVSCENFRSYFANFFTKFAFFSKIEKGCEKQFRKTIAATNNCAKKLMEFTALRAQH